jgi:serine/threonine protein kinase
VFSCGVVLFIMLTGRYPFYCATLEDKWYNLLMQKKISEYWKTFEGKISEPLSTEAQDLLQKMFACTRTERITLDEISEHAWY